MLRILTLATGLLAGAAGSQYPAFTDQYAQRIGGAVQELSLIAENFDASARAEGLTRAQALARLTGSSDAFVQAHGGQLAQSFDRLDRLSLQQARLTGGNPVSRLSVVATGADLALLSATSESFRPAVPLTLEGVLFGVIGYLLGSEGLRLLLRLVRRRPAKGLRSQ